MYVKSFTGKDIGHNLLFLMLTNGPSGRFPNALKTECLKV